MCVGTQWQLSVTSQNPCPCQYLACDLSVNLFQYYFLSYTETGNMDWTVTEWNQHSSAFSVKSKKRQVRSLCKIQLIPIRMQRQIIIRSSTQTFYVPPGDPMAACIQVTGDLLPKWINHLFLFFFFLNMSLWHTETDRQRQMLLLFFSLKMLLCLRQHLFPALVAWI